MHHWWSVPNHKIVIIRYQDIIFEDLISAYRLNLHEDSDSGHDKV